MSIKWGGCPHEQSTPFVKPNCLTSLFQLIFATPAPFCALKRARRCTKKLVSCCIWQCQAGSEGACVWAGLGGVGLE